MNTTTLTPTLSLLAALVLALSFAFACGDDDGSGATTTPIDLDQYFSGVGEIFDDAEESTGLASLTFDDGAPLEEQIDAIDTFLIDIDGAFSEAIERLEAIDAPEVVADGHANFIEGVRASVDLVKELRVDLPDIETQEQLDDRMAEFSDDLEPGVRLSDAACLALQEIADTEEPGIDLNCED